ncbi:MAG: histidine kinase N-terminal 7TM domain-containing protein [Myxococcota bacterium]|nr:histidine kinase N-terminal 7TM domain-containing protein [Myxococcota bacterium]
MLLYSIGLELTMLLTFWVCLAMWQRDHSTPGRTTFACLCLSATVWCAGELAAARAFVHEVVSDRIIYAGVLSLAPFWLGVAGHATRLPLARRVPWFALVLLAPNLFLYGLLFAGPWSGLLLTTREGVDLYGPLWWVGLTYNYALVIMGAVLFIVSAARWKVPGQYTRRMFVGAAPLVPLAGNAAYVAAGMTWTMDPTPLLFSVALLALGNAIFTGGLLQALPISQHDLIEQLPIGVVLTDRAGTVIDVNPAAERLLGISEATAVGRTLDAILSKAEDDVDAEITPIFSSDREAGQLVLIEPPAKEEIGLGPLPPG